jgi:hypothetical protein
MVHRRRPVPNENCIFGAVRSIADMLIEAFANAVNPFVGARGCLMA